MQFRVRVRFSLVLAAAFGFAAVLPAARADVVVTKDGSRLVGKVTKIDGTSVLLTTTYGGDLKLKQREVVSVEIDKPTNVRLQSGAVVQGVVVPVAGGGVVVRGEEAAVAAPAPNIIAIWAPGTIDPAVLALQRKWSYEATMDITGQTGDSNQLGSAASFRAIDTGPNDKLQLYTNYNRQRTDHVTSADQFSVGVDYADNFWGRNSWYVRDEGGFDHVSGIDFYDTAAAGLGHDLVKNPHHTLTGRLGLAYRYDDYANPATSDVGDVGFDISLHHEYDFRLSKLVNDIDYIPAISNSNAYEIKHQSYYEIPLVDVRWKLRLGMCNDYNSQPGTGYQRLNTTYFMRLVLHWK